MVPALVVLCLELRGEVQSLAEPQPRSAGGGVGRDLSRTPKPPPPRTADTPSAGSLKGRDRPRLQRRGLENSGRRGPRPECLAGDCAEEGPTRAPPRASRLAPPDPSEGRAADPRRAEPRHAMTRLRPPPDRSGFTDQLHDPRLSSSHEEGEPRLAKAIGSRRPRHTCESPPTQESPCNWNTNKT